LLRERVTYGSENFSFPVSQVIADDLGLDNLLLACLLDTILELFELLHYSSIIHLNPQIKI